MSFRTFTHHLMLGALSASLLLSAACGGGDDDAPSGGNDGTGSVATKAGEAPDSSADTKGAKFDPCQLLTAAELEEFAGEKMDAGEAAYVEVPMGQTLCTWGSTRETSLTIAQVSVVREQDFVDQLKKQKYTAKKLFDDGKAMQTAAQDVPGVGESAYRTGNSLTILHDGMVIAVSIGKQNLETATLVEMAKKAIARLP